MGLIEKKESAALITSFCNLLFLASVLCCVCVCVVCFVFPDSWGDFAYTAAKTLFIPINTQEIFSFLKPKQQQQQQHTIATIKIRNYRVKVAPKEVY